LHWFSFTIIFQFFSKHCPSGDAHYAVKRNPLVALALEIVSWLNVIGSGSFWELLEIGRLGHSSLRGFMKYVLKD
jgi:hypothetical protein